MKIEINKDKGSYDVVDGTGTLKARFTIDRSVSKKEIEENIKSVKLKAENFIKNHKPVKKVKELSLKEVVEMM